MSAYLDFFGAFFFTDAPTIPPTIRLLSERLMSEKRVWMWVLRNSII